MYLKKEPFGGLAQLGERLLRKQEVTGSIPALSTKRDWLKMQRDLRFHWVSWERNSDVPWKLNIVIIDAIYEKATVKENF